MSCTDRGCRHWRASHRGADNRAPVPDRARRWKASHKAGAGVAGPASIAFARNVASYCSRPRLRSLPPRSMMASYSPLATNHRLAETNLSRPTSNRASLTDDEGAANGGDPETRTLVLQVDCAATGRRVTRLAQTISKCSVGTDGRGAHNYEFQTNVLKSPQRVITASRRPYHQTEKSSGNILDKHRWAHCCLYSWVLANPLVDVESLRVTPSVAREQLGGDDPNTSRVKFGPLDAGGSTWRPCTTRV